VSTVAGSLYKGPVCLTITNGKYCNVYPSQPHLSTAEDLENGEKQQKVSNKKSGEAMLRAGIEPGGTAEFLRRA
jgi:hypothetical protein